MKQLILVLVLLAGNAMAQDETSPAVTAANSPPPPASCTSEQHHQFDFWIGEWNVTQNGQPAGHNLIRRVHGCALFENWTSATSNFTGSSLNTYDQASGLWHQTWVDSSGTLLQIDGGLVDGKMVMSSAPRGTEGNQTHNRITWTPNSDGSVLQAWETSPDGETWTNVFNGLYVKTAASE